jgi:hypothetical protein
MPNKPAVDSQFSKRGITQGSVTGTGFTLTGTMDEATFEEALRIVKAGGGTYTLVAGVVTIHY